MNRTDKESLVYMLNRIEADFEMGLDFVWMEEDGGYVEFKFDDVGKLTEVILKSTVYCE